MTPNNDAGINHVSTPLTDANGFLAFPTNQKKLASALRSLKNNRDAKDIAFHFVAPVVREALMFPDTAQDLHDLLLRWYTGALGGVSTKMSTAVGANGVGGVEFFEALLMHFVTQPAYKGRPRMIGSIYYMAKNEAGWVYEPADETDADAE